MFDPVTLLATVAPVFVEAGRALVNRYITPDTFKPSSFADFVSLQNIELERFKALMDADKGGETYRWVEAVRKLQRPFAVSVLVVAFVLHPESQAIANTCAVVTFYLFGERTALPMMARFKK